MGLRGSFTFCNSEQKGYVDMSSMFFQFSSWVGVLFRTKYFCSFCLVTWIQDWESFMSGNNKRAFETEKLKNELWICWTFKKVLASIALVERKCHIIDAYSFSVITLSHIFRKYCFNFVNIWRIPTNVHTGLTANNNTRRARTYIVAWLLGNVENS